MLNVIFSIQNYKKILKEKNIIFIIILIISTYSMVIVSSIIFIPIATPRYIIYVIPIIIYYLIYNLALLEEKFTKYTNKKFLFFLILIFFIINLIITNDNRPVKKPPINRALSIIKYNNEENIYIIGDKYLLTYVPTIKKFKEYNFKIINNELVNSEKVKSFAYLCINNPRFGTNKKNLPDDPICNRLFKNFDLYKKVYITDFLITFYKKNNAEKK